MDRKTKKAEIERLLGAELSKLREVSYEDLAQLVDNPRTATLSEFGQPYQVEIQAFWEGRKTQNLRVMVSVDDMSWSAFTPPSADFIISPDGSFIGE